MGSFLGHVLPGTLFITVGVWHLWSGVLRFVSDPWSFRVRSWNPVPGFGGRLHHLELYLITLGAFLDMSIELLYSPHFKYFVGGMLNPRHMNDFEHGAMLLMFFLYGVAALVSKKTRYLPLSEEMLFLLVATAFLAEYLLFSFHSTTHKGLEGYYHLMLLFLIGLCIAAAMAGALLPTTFAVDLSASVGITLQGLWFYQTAFTLYGPMLPKGCQRKHENGLHVICLTKMDEIRGELIANCQFFMLVFAVFALMLVFYSYAASRYGQQRLSSYLDGDGDEIVAG